MDSPVPGASGGLSSARMLAVLHPLFALTGVVHCIGGPLLPSLAPAFHLNDSQAGFLFLAYYAGTSLGALLCGRNHARTLSAGFAGLALACLAVAVVNRALLFPLFLLLGIGVGMPMTAVSMFAGRTFGARSAAPLTFLNFSWSVGALIAPLFAARMLAGHGYRAAYVTLAAAAALAAIAGRMQLEDIPEPAPAVAQPRDARNVGLIAIFALATFFQVGVENTTVSWLATYLLRTSGGGAALAAAATSFYSFGFLASRGVSSLLLLRMDASRLLGIAIAAGVTASMVLLRLPGSAGRAAAMLILGAALAPIFPLLLARFFARARQSSDSRWVLAFCGFGGSVLPWITGSISARAGSLRMGLMIIPGALLLMFCMLPLLGAARGSRPNHAG